MSVDRVTQEGFTVVIHCTADPSIEERLSSLTKNFFSAESSGALSYGFETQNHNFTVRCISQEQASRYKDYIEERLSLSRDQKLERTLKLLHTPPSSPAEVSSWLQELSESLSTLRSEIENTKLKHQLDVFIANARFLKTKEDRLSPRKVYDKVVEDFLQLHFDPWMQAKIDRERFEMPIAAKEEKIFRFETVLSLLRAPPQQLEEAKTWLSALENELSQLIPLLEKEEVKESFEELKKSAITLKEQATAQNRFAPPEIPRYITQPLLTEAKLEPWMRQNRAFKRFLRP